MAAQPHVKFWSAHQKKNWSAHFHRPEAHLKIWSAHFWWPGRTYNFGARTFGGPAARLIFRARTVGDLEPHLKYWSAHFHRPLLFPFSTLLQLAGIAPRVCPALRVVSIRFHGILPELREIGEGNFSFSSGKRENGEYGEKGK